MESERTNTDIRSDEKTVALATDSEQARVETRRLQNALEDDDTLEALKRLHHEISMKQLPARGQLDAVGK